ncbi:hypothetical protein [Methanospirillum hungatei]|nr:hypothetical protein [Methanospirillum hungatei]
MALLQVDISNPASLVLMGSSGDGGAQFDGARECVCQE